MKRTNQGGSILGFLIIGGVLAVLLLGGAYYVRQRAVPVAVTSDNKDQAAEKKDDTGKGQAAPAPEPAAETPKQEAPRQQEPSAVTPQSTVPSTTELPQTGLAETVSSMLGMGLLSGMIVAYVRSRRHPSATL